MSNILVSNGANKKESSGVKNPQKLAGIVTKADSNLKFLFREFSQLKENLEKMMIGQDGLALWSGEEAYAFFEIAVKNNNNNLADYAYAYNQVSALSNVLTRLYPKIWAGLKSKDGSNVKLNCSILKVPASVDVNAAIVNPSAADYKAKIDLNYTNIEKYFKALSGHLTDAKKCFAGSGWDKNLNSAATRCKNQASYCAKRRKNLTERFRYGIWEAKIYDLEKRVENISKSSDSAGA